MTEPEIMLWAKLGGRSPERPKFRRQQPIGSVIVDFYCPAARLAIEVDGATHWDDESLARDEARDHWLAGQGIGVVWIPASAIYRDLAGMADGVLMRAEALIAAEASRRPLAPSTTRSSLRSAGGPPPPLRRGGS
jgi:very-short-patch-repair endonuclease